MFRDCLFRPWEKNSSLALAQVVRFSVVRAAMEPSATVGRFLSASLMIHLSWLKIKINKKKRKEKK